MNVPDDLRYSTDHEWARVEGDKIRVGITDYAQDALGDIVFVELPSTGTAISAGDGFGEVESTKSVSDLYAPISGTIMHVNDTLTQTPESLNDDPYGDGWICKIKMSEPGEIESLLNTEDYINHIEQS